MQADPLAAQLTTIQSIQVMQAVLFLSLLLIVSVCDIRKREIPDRLQLALAATAVLDFSPVNLLGFLGAVPYLTIALCAEEGKGIGGGDIKLVAATGLVLGLSASLMASVLGLGCFVIFAGIDKAGRRFHGNSEPTGYPLGPFLALGIAAAYFMKRGGLTV